MILSKNNLLVYLMSGKDKDLPQLDNVHIEKNGSTVGASKMGILCVGPVPKKVKKELIDIYGDSKSEAATVSNKTIKNVVRNIPKDVLFQGRLEYTDMKSDEDGLEFTLHDGKRKHKIQGKKYNRKYIPYKKILRKQLNSPVKERIIVNCTRLRLLLEAIEKTCGDSSDETPIFLEFTENNDLILRAINQITGQRTLATMTTYEGKGEEWIKESKWEKKLRKKKKEK